MQNRRELREPLLLFNEKATKLLNSSFVQALLKPNTGFKISGEQQDDGSFRILTEVRGPSQESIDSFILTFRFFIQDNEATSLSNISKLYEDPMVESEYRNRFISARKEVNDLLNSPNTLNVIIDDARPTNREIMETFIYGGLAHANRAKKKVYDEWMSFPPIGGLLTTCFTMILGRVLEALKYIADLNNEVLQSLIDE
jgi:hypothetical protein